MRLVPRSGFVLALGVGLAIALAPHGARAGDPARDLGDIEPTEAKDVDDANTAEPQDLDQVLGEGAEDAHIVDSSDHEADAESTEGTTAESVALDQADKAPEWQPPSCDTVPVDLGSRPPASETGEWRAQLQAAEAAIVKAQALLEAADGEYTYARNRKSPRGEALAKIVATRDKAREDYAKARCSLPARVHEAQRLGVAPEAWRDFPASIE